MNEKDFVTLETAKLLKEKGFNEECYAYYRNGVLIYAMYQDYSSINDMLYQYILNDKIYTPTLYQAQKWLRKKHNCYVQVTYEAYKTGVNYLVQVLFYEPNDDDCWSDKSTGKYGDNAEFDSFEDALSFGILKALKRI